MGAALDVTQAPLQLGTAQALSGNGLVLGDVVVAGTLTPGNSVGTLHFENNLSLESSARVVMELTDATTYDVVIGSIGSLTFGGTIEILFLGGYRPGLSDAFHLFTGFASYHGEFSDIVFSDPGYEGVFDAGTGTLHITAIPEPSQWALIGMALLVISLLRRRSRLSHE